MALTAIDLVVEIHPQTIGAIADKPNLGVLALKAFRLVPMLLFEPAGDALVIPLELSVSVAGHGEGMFVFLVARHVLVNGQHQVKPGAEKEIFPRPDRALLESPRLDPVHSSADSVVSPA